MRMVLITPVCLIPLSFVLYDICLKKKRIAVLRSFSVFFEQIDKVLRYSPIQADLLFLSLAAEDVFSCECQMIHDALKNGFSFQQAWLQAFQKNNQVSLLPEKLLTFIHGFSEQFGKGHLQDQHILCDKYFMFCASEIEKRQADLDRCSKQNLSMSVLTGLLIFIILY